MRKEKQTKVNHCIRVAPDVWSQWEDLAKLHMQSVASLLETSVNAYAKSGNPQETAYAKAETHMQKPVEQPKVHMQKPKVHMQFEPESVEKPPIPSREGATELDRWGRPYSSPVKPILTREEYLAKRAS